MAIKRYYELHYEELVNNPSLVLNDLLSFLNEDWDDGVIKHHEYDHDYKSEITEELEAQKPIFTESVGRWENELSNEEIENILSIHQFRSLLRNEKYID